MLLHAFLAEGVEYGGENLIREESVEAESQEESTSDTVGEKLNSQPEEEEQTSSTEQSSLDPEVERTHAELHFIPKWFCYINVLNIASGTELKIQCCLWTSNFNL